MGFNSGFKGLKYVKEELHYFNVYIWVIESSAWILRCYFATEANSLTRRVKLPAERDWRLI